MNRRQLLSTAALTFLVGCTAQQATKAQSDLDLIVALGQAFAPAVEQAAKVSPDDAGKITAAVATIQSAGTALIQATGQPNATVAQQFIDAVKALAPFAIEYFAEGSPWVTAVTAAIDLLPVALAAVGITVAPTARMLTRSAMTPADARTAIRVVVR